MERDYLILKSASASRPSGEWNDDDYDVLCNGVVVGSFPGGGIGDRGNADHIVTQGGADCAPFSPPPHIPRDQQ